MTPAPLSLSSATGVTVYSAPPGSGKSHHARRLIASAFKSGDLHRVVWAVHSTLQEDSLGDEAHREFTQMLPADHKVSILLGRCDPDGNPRLSEAEYEQQLQWSNEPEIKIASFRHLPHLFERSAKLSRLKPELLVIDECPWEALVQQIDLSLDDLYVLAQSAGGVLAQRLVQIAQDCASQRQDPTRRFPRNVTGRGERLYLTGMHFLQALQPAASQESITRFQQALKGIEKGLYVTQDWADALLSDTLSPEANSYRFGIRWSTGSSGQTSEGPTFYSSVLLPLKLPPTLVLDAYPNRDFYRALFPGSDVNFIEAGRSEPLRIEHAPMLRIYKQDLHVKSRDAQRQQIADEIISLYWSQKTPISILADKALFEGDSPLMTALDNAQARLGQADLRFLYHHAGRGINAHTGRTLVALTSANLPLSVQLCDMAALFPSDEEQRKQAFQHLVSTERLQMLHRNRQAQSAPGARIISAVPPTFKEELCDLVDYQPILHFIRGSPNPRRRTALSTILDELICLAGGIARPMLAALGLAAFGRRQTDAKKSAHTAAFRAFLAAQDLEETPLLRSWLEDGHFGAFGRVEPYRKNDTEISQALVRQGLELRLSNVEVRYAGERLRTQIWALPGVDESALLKCFYPESKP